MPHSLFDDFKDGEYHSSILSTFSVDPAFYDSSLQLRLRSTGCLNNLLIADASMLDNAIEAMPEAFVNAGRKYLIAPIATSACFHPKLSLRFGKDKARLIVGSANTTTAGWSANLELVSSMTWRNKDDDEDRHIHRTLIIRAHHWLCALLDNRPDSNITYKLELLRSQSPWINETLLTGDKPFQLSDGSEIDLLLSDPMSKAGLGDKMLSLIDESVERLTIISPYWDHQLSALRRLIEALNHPDLRIFLSLNNRSPSRSSTFPVDALRDLSPTFHDIKANGDNTNRFLHAKMFLFHGEKHDFMFIGSANCTVAALGYPGKTGINHECLLYRKLPRGIVTQLLNLSFNSNIDKSDIVLPPKVSEPSIDPGKFKAGSVERRFNKLIWFPTPNLLASEALIRVGTADFVLSPVSDGTWEADIGEAVLDTNIGRILLTDGRVSRSIIIDSPADLIRFAPIPISDSLRKKLESVINGDSDLITLARDIDLLLEDDEKTGYLLKRQLTSDKRATISNVVGRDYATPEDFRNALTIQASLKSAGLVHGENPALQALLKIVLRGMVNIEPVEKLDTEDLTSATGLVVGDDQDDVEQLIDVLAPPIPNPLRMAHKKSISIGEFQRNEKALWRGINKFQKFLQRAKSSKVDLDLNFVTRSLFMLHLMLYGCTKEYILESGETKVIIPFTTECSQNFRKSFLFIAAQIIADIWGPNYARSLIRQLNFRIESNILPIQVTTLVVISRWVLAAILSEVRIGDTDKSLRELSMILEKQVPSLFEMTKVFPELDRGEMLATINQMEENIGMTNDLRSRIRATLDELTIITAAK